MRLPLPAAIVALVGSLGCDPGGPGADGGAPTDATTDGAMDAAGLDAAADGDAAAGSDAGDDPGDAAVPSDASQGEGDAGVTPVECEETDDFPVPSDPAGTVIGASAAALGGGFVVAWAVVDGIDTFVRARLLDECAVAEGGDIDVDVPGLAVGRPVVAAVGGTEDFVVAWSREDGDGDGAGVLYRRFGPDGGAIGDEVVANEETFDDQIVTAAAALPAGFALAWEDHSGGVLVRPDAVLATFDETGRSITGEVAVSARTDGPQNLPLLAAAGDGTVLAVWSEDGLALGRARDEGGWMGADEFPLSDAPALPTCVASRAGGFAVALTSTADDAEGDIVLALVETEGAEPVPSTITAETGTERDPVVVALTEGLLVAWTDETERNDPDADDPSGTAVMATLTDETGLVRRDRFLVPTTIDFDQELRAGAAGPGGVLLVWLDASRADGDDDGGLRGRLITALADP